MAFSFKISRKIVCATLSIDNLNGGFFVLLKYSFSPFSMPEMQLLLEGQYPTILFADCDV